MWWGQKTQSLKVVLSSLPFGCDLLNNASNEHKSNYASLLISTVWLILLVFCFLFLFGRNIVFWFATPEVVLEWCYNKWSSHPPARTAFGLSEFRYDLNESALFWSIMEIWLIACFEWMGCLSVYEAMVTAKSCTPIFPYWAFN